jgi:hypothetical protein
MFLRSQLRQSLTKWWSSHMCNALQYRQQLGSVWLELEGGSTDSLTANGRQQLQSAWLELKEDWQTHSLQTVGNNLDQRGSSLEDQQTHSLRLPIQSRVYMRCKWARMSAISHPFSSSASWCHPQVFMPCQHLLVYVERLCMVLVVLDTLWWSLVLVVSPAARNIETS